MRTLYLPDTPIGSRAEDKLGLTAFVDVVHSALLDTRTPYVFGVFGDWGSGKTSAMRLLECRLNEDIAQAAHFNFPIWLNAWKFENELNMIYPILFALKQDYEVRLKDEAKTRQLKSDLVRIVGSSMLALSDLSLRAISKAVTGEAISVKDIKEHLDDVSKASDPLEEALDSWATQINQLPELYETFVANYAAQLAERYRVKDPEQIRFTFLIDDLDRCLPDTVIAVLERVKNFLSVKRCVYVLGVNQFIVQQGIRAKFSAIELDGREYLEKIVNHAFYVPEAGDASVKDFAVLQLAELLPDVADRDRLAPELETFGKTLGECGFYNPRKIKRVLNRFLAFLARHDERGKNWQTGNIVRLLIMAEYFPAVFQIFGSDTANAKKALLSLADGTSDFPAFERRYGVTLGLGRERISGMRGLFDLASPFQADQPTLNAQVDAVAQFTRVR